MLKRITDISDKIENLREKGLQRGDLTGFACLDELYSIKPDSVTIIQGAPTHGKSEFIFELAMNQAEKYGKITAVNSPETGSAEEIAMALIHKFLRKNAYKSSGYGCSDLDFEMAKNWVNYHFVIFDDEQSYTVNEMFSMIDEFEKTHSLHISIVIGEPYNELRHDMKETRQDIYIEGLMSEIRRYCKTRKKHFFLSIHPGMQAQQKDQQTGILYYPMPKAREASGGQAMFRKAMSWINIWRPPVGMIDVTNNRPYEDNDLIIVIEKSKPKGIGKKGVCHLRWDWKKDRYFEEIDGQASFAFEHTKPTKTYTQSTMPMSTQFNDEPPF